MPDRPTPPPAKLTIGPRDPAHRERLRIGGCGYVVEVHSADGGFQGGWVCPACGQSGQSRAVYSEISTAVSWAKAASTTHHLAVHGVE